MAVHQGADDDDGVRPDPHAEGAAAPPESEADERATRDEPSAADTAADRRDAAAELRDRDASARDLRQAVETALHGGDDDSKHRNNRHDSMLDRHASAQDRRDAADDRRRGDGG